MSRVSKGVDELTRMENTADVSDQTLQNQTETFHTSSKVNKMLYLLRII